MAKRSVTRASRRAPRSSSHGARHPASPTSVVPIISHQPGKGLVVSTGGGHFPESPGAKIMCAKSIIQAVVAAHDSGNLDGQNYEITWPLEGAIGLLEDATEQVNP